MTLKKIIVKKTISNFILCFEENQVHNTFFVIDIDLLELYWYLNSVLISVNWNIACSFLLEENNDDKYARLCIEQPKHFIALKSLILLNRIMSMSNFAFYILNEYLETILR